MIPKVIHRTVPAAIDPVVEGYWRELQRLHPGWELKTWRDPLSSEEFELGHLFERCRSGAELADLVRLEVLWRYGGIYVDSDCEPVASLEPLRRYPFFIGTEDGTHLTNAVMGAEPHHPAVRAYMDAILVEDRLSLDVSAAVATGPVLATQVLADRSDVTVLPPEFFYPLPPSDDRIALERTSVKEVSTRFTYLVHRWSYSWRPPETPEQPASHRLTAMERVGGILKALRRSAVMFVRKILPPVIHTDMYEPAVYAVYVGDRRMIVRMPDGSPLIALASDRSLTPSLVVHGTYDPPFRRFLERYVRPGDHVVDVGANVGVFSLRMAQLVGRFGRVHVYEADPELCEVLTETLQLNWVADRVTINPVAAGRTSGEIRLSRHERFRGSTSSSESDDKTGHAVADGYVDLTVPAVRLDEAITSEIPLRLVKIDVEGGEAAVIDGMTKILDARALHMLDVEVIRGNASNWLELVKALERLTTHYGASVNLLAQDGSLQETSLDHVVGSAGHFSHVVFVFD